MRKIIKWFSILFICACLITISSMENYYRCNARVCKATSTTTTFLDDRGEKWEWENEENESYEWGEKVQIKFATNGTMAYIYDDEIIFIKSLK